MLYIKQIMELFSLEKEMAEKVFFQMQIDFSECSDSEFYKEAKWVLDRLMKNT